MIRTRGRGNVPIRSPFKAHPISAPGGYTTLDIHPAGQYQAVSPRSVQPPCGGIRACACIFILRTRGGDDEGVGVWIFDKTAKISTENRFRPASVWGRQFNDIGGEGWGYLSLSLFLFIPRQSMRKQLEGYWRRPSRSWPSHLLVAIPLFASG